MNISQEKLAELADVSVQMIKGIEGRRTWVSDAMLENLARVLGVKAFQLLIPGIQKRRRMTRLFPAYSAISARTLRILLIFRLIAIYPASRGQEAGLRYSLIPSVRQSAATVQSGQRRR